jgi:hypothetical protein
VPFLPVTGFLSRLFSQDKALSASVRQVTGVEPQNVRLIPDGAYAYLRFKANGAGRHETNERLEFLGDAILGAVVAEFLYKKFPYKQEGFLTEIRSRIVNREMLNSMAIRIGLNTLIKTDQANPRFRINLLTAMPWKLWLGLFTSIKATKPPAVYSGCAHQTSYRCAYSGKYHPILKASLSSGRRGRIKPFASRSLMPYPRAI